jgi:adenylate kinase family enzyme
MVAESSDIEPVWGEIIDSSLYCGLGFNSAEYQLKPDGSVLIFGPSGGGKDDRGNFLADYFGLGKKVSSGDVFRALIRSFDESAVQKIQQYRDRVAESSNAGELELVAHDHGEVKKFMEDESISYAKVHEAVALFQQTCGFFVEDEVYLQLMQDAFEKQAYKGPRVFDGHIRRASQVEPIMRMIEGNDSFLDGALVVHANLAMIQTRTEGRRHCAVPRCGNKYNTSIHGVENQGYRVVHAEGRSKYYCGSHPDVELSQRPDDQRLPVTKRLGEYRAHAHTTLQGLSAAEVHLMIVAGDLKPFNDESVRDSVLEAVHGQNSLVQQRFSDSY